VAEAQSLAKRIGLTRVKAAVIAVLAVALIAVIYIRFGSADDGVPATLAEPAGSSTLPEVAAPALPAPAVIAEAPDPTTQAALPDQQTAVTAQFDEAKWKPPELTMVVAYDPFALPSEFPQPVRTAVGEETAGGEDGSDAAEAAAKLAEAIESLQTELRTLQERGVHVIIRGRDQYVAMIGDRTVHVGDEINGFTVTSIEADGVRVERKLAE
jgi:hypothetical protein